MKWIFDSTGRFRLRPYYETDEIDFVCDSLISEFLKKKYGSLKMPILTEDIELLIESKTSDFDPYADLTGEGSNVEGMTEFYREAKPAIFVSETLNHYSLENRRRSTLAHELGHAILHAPLLKYSLLDLDVQQVRCNRAAIEIPNENDWMEWQAYCASGAYLMPISQVELIASGVIDIVKDSGPFYVDSSAGRGLIDRVKRAFLVSGAAARVRLQQLNHITKIHEEATVKI